jgi:cytochrome c5
VYKLIRKIGSHKNFKLAASLLLFIVICIAIYLWKGIEKNEKLMAEDANETVTYFPEYPATNTSGKNADVIKRGEYLAKAGDCMACHTNTGQGTKAKPFAGGLPMHTPFGTIYAPNITPDKETGIGNWTEEEFMKAMSDGVSPQGHYYYPAFPYLYFSKITPEDLKALKAYLDSIPAVRQKNIENDMLWPFNWRFMQLGWRILFFNQENVGPYQSNPQRSEKWNRGAYIVEGLGHCAMCHSPSYHILSKDIPLGAPVREYDLTGSKIQGFLAPNITHANLADIPLEKIAEVFTKDNRIGGGKITGPMLEVNHDSLSKLEHDDLLSIATYLKEVESKTPPKPTGSAVGQAIYETYCSGCHVSGAGGAPKYGDKASWEPALKQGVEQVYNNAIHGVGGMPAKGTCLSCTDDEIKQSVDYMLDSTKSGGGRGPIIGPKPKPLSMEIGKEVYQNKCSVCHNGDYKNAPKVGDKPAWQKSVDAGFLKTYMDVISGKGGHPVHGACPTCSDAEIKAATKYMMQESSTGKDYSLW